MDKRLGVAVIGLGVGEQHALAYASLKECRLIWLYDLNKSRSEKIASTLNCEVAEGLEQILEDPEVDIVSIASFDDDHFDQTVSALNAGKHVFVEKPMCRSLEELRKIREVWEINGRKMLTSNLVLRAAVVYQWLKSAIQSGMFGDVYAFDGDYLYGRRTKITDGWRKNVENYSVIQGGGVHLVDLMLLLTGQRPTNVYAIGNNICTRGTDFKYNDFVATTYIFSSGLVGRITANFGCVHHHQHFVRVFGTNATFVYDDKGPRLFLNMDPIRESKQLNIATLPYSKGDLIPPFVRSILKQGDLLSTQHEFDVISACVAADRSIDCGRPVEVDYI